MIISVNLILVIITCIVSFVCFSNQTYFNKGAHNPYLEHHRGEKYRLLTSGFLHADHFHLFINMFVLYQFGAVLEDVFVQRYGYLGSYIYFVFYLVMIVLANLYTHFKYQDVPSYRAIGASGATSAVLFAYIYYYPLSMLGLYMVIPVPAIVFGVLYLWYSSWASKKNMDNIGHDAHLYGALAGFLTSVILDLGQMKTFINTILGVFQGLL